MLIKNTSFALLLLAAVVSLAFTGCEKPAGGTAKSDKSAPDTASGEAAKLPGKATETPPPADTGTQLAAAPKIDPTKVPDGDVAALIEHLTALRQQQPTAATEADAAAEQKQLQEGIIATADKILADPKLQPGDRLRVVTAKWQALGEMMSDGSDSGKERFIKFTESLVNDADEDIAANAQNVMLQLKFVDAQQGKPTDFKEVAAGIAKRLETRLTPQNVQMAQMAVRMLEMYGATDEAKTLYTAMEKGAASATNPMLAEMVKQMAAGGLARLNLVGTAPKIEGTLITGEKFDWAKYRGKIVLLDFWATWCGPCLQELPNVKKAYEEFGPKGFEVVGISLDDDEAKLKEFLDKEKLPWVTLFGENPEARGFDLPLAKEFGVDGIPATYLVDKEGTIVSVSARGPMLESQLKKLLRVKEEAAKP